jgi:hypothetical protein
MKNIHLLPTDKPSEFYSIDGKHKLANSTMAMDWYISSVRYKPHNIFITSSEIIKVGDWYISVDNFIRKADAIWDTIYGECPNKKIILTTDQDLIKNGVQPIDDNFLEWFVKNPSCEFIEVKKVRQRSHLSLKDWVDEDENGDFPMSIAGAFSYRMVYKIIIPQEEPKQETLEKVAANLADSNLCKTDNWIAGAEWQAERMYSDLEVYDILIKHTEDLLAGKRILLDEWFEQFKKK